MDDTTNDVIVGIDLGTTNYSVAIYSIDSCLVFENENKLERAPCFVFFSSNKNIHVGVGAKRLQHVNVRNGVYDIKSFLGREYNDKEVQNLIPRMLYTVEDHLNVEPVFVVKLSTGDVRVTPIWVCALILDKIKKDIESELGKHCNMKAVITVPANFNKNQREATLEAARRANIQVLELMYEPTAIMIYHLFFYYNIETFEEGDIFLVYNLGRSRFTITIFKIIDNKFCIVDVFDETSLSGLDFDQVVFNYLWDELNKKHDFSKYPNTDFTPLKHHLQIKSEEIKIQMSEKPEAYLLGHVNASLPFRTRRVNITRSQFEELAEDLLQEAVHLINRCFQKHNLSKSLIKKVFLGGGSFNIPKVQELLVNWFKEAGTQRWVFKDTTVAKGAAVYAGRLSTKQLY